MRGSVVAIAMLCACARGGASASQGDGPPLLIDAPRGSADAAAPDARAPDASNGCAMQPCTIDPQCGCSDPSMPACDLGSASGTACRAANAGGVEGQTCAYTTACAIGYTCVGNGSDFSCEKYCASTSECISPRGQCVDQLVDGSNQPIAGAVTCSSNCDPTQTTNALCPTGWTCDLYNATYMGTTYNTVDCRRAGTATQGQTCSNTVACAAGYTCVSVTSGGTTTMQCARLCAPPSNTGCPANTTCQSFGTPFKVPSGTGTEYGACF